MTKEEEKALSKKIQQTIKKVSSFDDDYLVHIYKIMSSKTSTKEKALFDPLLKAVDKERKARGVKEIDSKIVAIKNDNKVNMKNSIKKGK